MDTLSTATQSTGVCAAKGFSVGVAAANIRGDGDLERLDIALIISDRPCTTAGVFTQNQVKAASVMISQQTLSKGQPIHAVLTNSGNANACTGNQGFEDARQMCAIAAEALGIKIEQVLVCSTGMIGRPMPMDRVGLGIQWAAANLTTDGLVTAKAIMTTDLKPKTAAVTFSIDDCEINVGGMAKGAGMMHPNMATMLAFLTSDAAVDRADLLPILQRVSDQTFNCITVDGDTSTNDACLLMCNGAAGGAVLKGNVLEQFEQAIFQVCESLSEQLIADAEGASRYFKICVNGAKNDQQANSAARVVASSPLVKTAIHGGDPNWGRIVAALGRSGIEFELDNCSVSIGGITIFDRGSPVNSELEALRKILSSPRLEIAIELGIGNGTGHAWGCDLSAEYVSINADYTT